MKRDNSRERSMPVPLSRREFLGAIGVLGLSPLSGAASGETGESATPPRFLLQWGQQGKRDGDLDACVGIAINENDEIYTSEFSNERIQKFSAEGRFLSAFAVQPHAAGLAVDREGNVYVAHWNSNKLAVYSPSGKLLREWGRKGSGDGEFLLPGSVALGPDGLLYVPDQGNSRVQKFTRDGKFAGKWGKHGKEPGDFGGGWPAGGRFAGPQFVAFDRAGNVYTTDTSLARVQKSTPEGKLLAFWGTPSTKPGGFGPPPGSLGTGNGPVTGGPIALCLDRQDRVWVSTVNHRVQQFTNDGKYLQGLVGEGAEPGQFNRPHGLAVDSRGCLYVADTLNHRIQKFAIN
jgi:sugar lactone lactonase YvrE